jgi:lysozyme family protein
MDNFDQAFDLTISHEGGFTRNRKDRGNWTSGQVGKGALKGTKYGVSAMTYPHLDIENLTLEQAKEIYRHDFWAKAGCEALPSGVDFLVFDAAINHGINRSLKFLQEAVGAVPDGIFGPKTLKRVTARPSKDVIREFSARRCVFYAGLHTFPAFGLGWTRRAVTTTMEAVSFIDTPALDQSKEAPKASKGRWFRRLK